MKRQLRKFVMKTGQFAPFEFLYRKFYQVTALMFEHWAARQTEVAGLCLRGSYARGDYTPGRSDLDFIMLVSSQIDDPTLFEFLARFRKGFASTKRLIPFLGEVEIIEQDYCSCWLDYTLDRQDLQAVYGPQLALRTLPGEQERSRKVLSDFMYFLLPNLAAWSSLETRRLYQKILKTLAPGEAQRMGTRWQQSAHLFKLLEPACESLALDLSPFPWHLDQKLEVGDLPQWLMPWKTWIESFVSSPYDITDCLLVLSPDFPQNDLAGLIQKMCEQLQRPLFFTPGMLRAFLTLVSPIQSLCLTAHRRVWPHDNAVFKQGLGGEAFDQGMRYSAAFILSYVHSHQFDPAQAESHLLGWFLRLKRYLEDGVGETDSEQVLEHYRRADPALFSAITAALEKPEAVRDFALYRRLSRDLGQALERARA